MFRVNLIKGAIYFGLASWAVMAALAAAGAFA